MTLLAITATLAYLSGCMTMFVLHRLDRIQTKRLAAARVAERAARARLPAWAVSAEQMPQDRDEAVLYVLRRQGDTPIGPTEIGRQINQPWVSSAAISKICRRLGAVHHEGGLYSAPIPFCSTQPGEE